MPLRKKVSYVGLKDFDYLIRDTSLTSPDFFNVVHFPEKFKAGKNLFKLRAHPSNLVNFSEIFIEILDYNGNPVYYEPLNYIEKDGTRVIAVYIYEDTAPDTCTVYLAGRTAVNPITGEIIPSTPNDRTSPNVLWSRNITIAPNDRNDVEIIYTQYPSLVVSEVVQSYLQPTNVYNLFTQLSGSGTIAISPAPSQVIGGLINNTLNGPTGPGTTTPQGAGSAGTPSYGDQFYNLTPTENSLALSNGATALSPPLNTLNGYSLLTTSGFSLTSQMEGGVIVVRQPNITIQPPTRGKSGLVYPNSQVNEANTNILGTTSQLSGSIKFAIVNVINSTQALVSQFDGFKNANDNTYGPFNIRLRKQLQGGQFVTYTATALQASSNFTASYIQPTATVLTQNSASFADIILTDIEPATGDVYKIKTLYKPSGFFGDFIDLGDTILEQTDLLIDTGSLETNVVIGSYYENYGRFDNLAEISQYWETSSLGSVSNPFTLTYDTATLIGGARLQTNWSPANQYIASIGDACIFNIRTQYRPSVTKNTEYLVKFKIANDTTIADYSSNDSNIPNARLDVYVSGSRITLQEETRYVQAGEIFTVANINATLTGDFRDNGPLGTRIGTYQVKHSPSSYSNVIFRFKAEDNGPLDIKFVTRRGSFILADIQLLADKETGYSPNYTRLSKRIPTEHLNTPLTFKFQYFDYRGNKADLESIAFGAVFDGDNTYIDGVNNLITGSIFLSNQTNSGIEMAGVSSGFIRSVGFIGVNSGSEGGILFYSGSILRNVTDEFKNGGAGFTAAATTESYIRVNTVNEELTIKSAGFTLSTTKGGNIITSFTGSVGISGSTIHDGYIQLNPVSTNIDNSISASYIYVSGSTNDLYFTQNGRGYNNTTRLRWLEGNLYTGLLYGGRISSASSTTFNISSGSGIIVSLNATTTQEPYPTIRYISWPNLTNQSLTYLNFAIQTFIGIDSSGTIIQQTDPWSDGQYNTSLSIGTVLHQNLLSINGFISYPNVAYGYKQRTYDFIKAFGPLKLSGYSLYTSGSLGLTVGSGSAFADGRNYQTDPNNPSYIVDPGTSVSKIFRYYVSASTYNQDTNAGAGYTVIDPSQYNNNGVLTSISPSTPWSNQRVFWYPNSVTKAVVVYYGSATYASDTEAIANLPYEAFFETPNTQQNAVYLGAITIKYNGTFATPADYRILPAGIFRNIGGSGGGTSIPAGGSTLPGGSNNQVQYNSGSGFAGSPNFTFVSASNAVYITGSLTISGSSTFRNIGPAAFDGNTSMTGSLNITGSDNLINISPQASGNGIVINNSGYLKFNASAVSYIRGFSSGTLFAVYNSAFTNIFNIGTSAASYINTGTNFLVGTTTDIGGRLSVRGSGATSGTTALRVENTNASASLVVRDDGYVGIGTTSPSHLLSLGTGSIAMVDSYPIRWGTSNLLYGSVVGLDIASSAFAVRFRFTTGGNLLIGTTTDPGYKLNVSGSGNFTNGLTVTGSVIATSFTGSLQGTASYALIVPAAGVNTNVQYNSNGNLAGSNRFKYNSGISTLSLEGTSLITGSLIVSGSTVNAPGLDTTTAVLTRGTITKIDWANGYLQDSTGTTSTDWETRTLFDLAGGSSIDWNGRVLYDSGVNTSIDWENRQLLTPGGYNALVYNTDVVTNSDIYSKQTISTGIQEDSVSSTTYSGQTIIGTLTGVSTHQLVYLDTDGAWKPTKATVANGAAKMLGICVDSAKNQILIEGDAPVSDDASQGAYVIGADHGLPVYVSATTGVMDVTAPSGVGELVRIVGHIYYQSTTDINWWTMKFRPSNDWYVL